MLTRGARGPETGSHHQMKETVNVVLFTSVQTLLRRNSMVGRLSCPGITCTFPRCSLRPGWRVCYSEVTLLKSERGASAIRAGVPEPYYWPDVPSLAPRQAKEPNLFAKSAIKLEHMHQTGNR